MNASNDIPDRGGLLTEQRLPDSMALDTMSAPEIAALMNEQDASVAAAVRRALGDVVSFIEAVEPRLRAGGRLVYLGAGTSGRLGVLDASECPPTFQTPPGVVIGLIAGGDSALRRSSEGAEDDPRGAEEALRDLVLTERDSVLGIAAGGTTPYVLGALEAADRAGALTGLLTCARAPTPICVRHHIVVETGPEVLTGSTRLKAGTATKMVLNTITTTLFVRRGKCYENLMVDLSATNAKLRDRAARIVATLCGVERTDALVLLDKAGGSVKAAAVMGRLGCTREEARQRLDAASGVLRAALEG